MRERKRSSARVGRQYFFKVRYSIFADGEHLSGLEGLHDDGVFTTDILRSVADAHPGASGRCVLWPLGRKRMLLMQRTHTCFSRRVPVWWHVAHGSSGSDLSDRGGTSW